MTNSWLLATVHLLALGIGFGSCWMRGRALAKTQTVAHLPSVFFADNMYGIATLLWIVSGLWRAFGTSDKGSEYYLNSQTFWIKMGLFGVVFLLELYPMISLIKWRIALKKEKNIQLDVSKTLAMLSYAELVAMVAMVLAATALARGM